MKSAGVFAIGTLIGVAVGFVPMLVAHIHAREHSSGNLDGVALAHTSEKFEFTAKAPMAAVAPLFGAEKERVWAPGWNPEFVWPRPAADREGMVFRVAHGHLHSVWANTRFDLKDGNVQYAYVIPGALATVITIHMDPRGNETRVSVQYERTALSGDANDHAKQLAEQDRKSGPEWEGQINGYLLKASAPNQAGR